jgi:hypothetical protein
MRCVTAFLSAAVAALVLSAAQPAGAYDTGPHAELTQDAMTTEGFGGDAIGVARVNNWFVDFYENGKKNPFSGHGGFWKRLMAVALRTEHWSDEVMNAADRSHFDSATTTLFNSVGVNHEWDRLRRATWTLVREARDEDDPAKLLTVLGMSLHQVQDFYTHTNWIEPQTELGAEGPGWQERGYGSSPTWFDVPADVREGATIYTANTKGHTRQHGEWNGDHDKNHSLARAMSKDWPGRPLYLQSATTAYFASRQWLQAVRSWVADDAFWAKAQQYHANQRQLAHDLRGAFRISWFGGHWQGQGEPLGGERGPGGSLLSLRQAITYYFDPVTGMGLVNGRTQYRKRFEELITRMADPNPTGQLGPVPSSQDLQRQMRFVVLRINDMRSRGLGDPGPDDADMYAKVRIDGQEMTSAIINGHDNYSFPDPNEPFTWIKVVPAVPDEGEPVESIDIDMRTADVSGAGTDDDVYLRLGRNLRFPLDKRLYDDFERGDRDTYSVPIDDAVRDGLRVGDITRVAIEKSRDGLSGGWKLGGIRLRVNGRVVYVNQRIDRWLEDGHRTFAAPDFVASAPRGRRVPVTIEMLDDDWLSNDLGDVNPFDRRRVVSVGYAPGEPFEATTVGGGKFGGRIDDGDEAKIKYSLETITPEPITAQQPSGPQADPGPDPSPTPDPGPNPTPTPTPQPKLKPDLIITAFTAGGVTVKNQGPGKAGPFRVRASNATAAVSETFTGLAPGASESRMLPLPCTASYVAVVDDLGQVDETDETNNLKDSEPIIC